MAKKMQDIRDAFFDQIYKEGSKNANVIIVTNDMDVFSLREFKKKYPERFVNVGVAEQNMVNVAAGLASCGKKVIIYGITPFLVYRCFEQIKFNICSMNLPVVFAGIGSGLSFSFDGPTHHATHDIGVLLTLPEMEIYNPGDIYSSSKIANIALNSKKPIFVRIDKGFYPKLNTEKSIIDNSFGILKPLQDFNIITTGSMTSYTLEISDALGKMGVLTGVVDLFKIKPISKKLINLVFKKSKIIFIIEENSLCSGIASAIKDELIQENLLVPLVFFGIKNAQIFDYGDREWLLTRMGIKKQTIVQAIYKKCVD